MENEPEFHDKLSFIGPERIQIRAKEPYYADQPSMSTINTGAMEVGSGSAPRQQEKYYLPRDTEEVDDTDGNSNVIKLAVIPNLLLVCVCTVEITYPL